MSNAPSHSTRGLLEIFQAFTNQEFVPLVTHSLDVAKIASALCLRIYPGRYPRHFVYLAGLFHDWGLLVYNSSKTDLQFSRVLNTIMFPSSWELKSFDLLHLLDVFEGEDHYYNHSRLIASIYEYIGFPEIFVSAARFHHQPENPALEDPEARNLAELLYTADHLSLTFRKHCGKGMAAGLKAVYDALQSEAVFPAHRVAVTELFDDLFDLDRCLDNRLHLDRFYGEWRPSLGTFVRLVETMSFIQDYRSPFTCNHSFSIGSLAREIGREMLTESDAQELYLSGLIHDFGKISIPLEILHKPETLTPCETRVMKTHIIRTKMFTETITDFKEILLTAVYHHERLDGSGYPYGMRAPELNLKSRILQVCDVYVALVEDRPYRAGVGRSEALGILEQEVREGRLDGQVFRVLQRIVEDGYRVGEYRDVLTLLGQEAEEV